MTVEVLLPHPTQTDGECEGLGPRATGLATSALHCTCLFTLQGMEPYPCALSLA